MAIHWERNYWDLFDKANAGLKKPVRLHRLAILAGRQE